MTEALTIWLAQYAMICLLGLQSINVNRGRYMASALTSLLLGFCGYFVTGIIASVYQSGEFGLVFWAFITAGPCGIVTSIWLNRHITKKMILPIKSKVLGVITQVPTRKRSEL